MGGKWFKEDPIAMPVLFLSVCPHQCVLLGLHFHELSWDHTFPDEEEHILWLEFDGETEGTPVNKLLKIYSKQVGGGCAGNR